MTERRNHALTFFGPTGLMPLLVGWTVLLISSFEASAQDVPLPGFGERKLSRVEKACMTMVKSYVVVPATTGDAREACRCAAAAASVSGLSVEDFLRQKDVGEMLSIGGMFYRSEAELNTSPSKKLAAKELFQKTKRCMANIALHGDYFELRDPANVRSLPLVEGPARGLGVGEGSLMQTSVDTIPGAIGVIVSREYNSFDPDEYRAGAVVRREFMQELKEKMALDDEAFKALYSRVENQFVIRCVYDIGEKNYTSKHYIFWNPHERLPEEVIEKLSPEHPLRSVGTVEVGCPLMQPDDG
jgi:hypothetical protein